MIDLDYSELENRVASLYATLFSDGKGTGRLNKSEPELQSLPWPKETIVKLRQIAKESGITVILGDQKGPLSWNKKN